MTDEQAAARGGPAVVSVGILGGTGPLGRALALRLATAGLRVVIGSRSAQRAAEAAAELPDGVTGADNAACAGDAEVVIVAVPWEAHASVLGPLRDELAGKVVVDAVNPLGFDAHGPLALEVPEGSACEQAQSLLPDSMVVGAFHHVPAPLLLDPDVERIEADVLIVADDAEAAARVGWLVGRIPGMRGVHAGRLRDARQVEALTTNLIAINRAHGAHSSLRVVGV